MKSCLICHNPAENHSICNGCLSLVDSPANTCKICAIELQHDEETCGHCQKIPPHYSKTHFACGYQFPADEWVKGLKFANQLQLSKLMAELMLPQLREEHKSFQLVPVPLHKSRLRLRGYNQAYEMARELAKMSGMDLYDCLRRARNTKMQAQLKTKDRAANVRGAFSTSKEVKDRHLLLIDDVMTSGNTLNECARVLKRSGAKEVQVLVFARRS